MAMATLLVEWKSVTMATGGLYVRTTGVTQVMLESVAAEQARQTRQLPDQYLADYNNIDLQVIGIYQVRGKYLI